MQCTKPSMASGGSATFTVVTEVSPGWPTAFNIDNQASVTPDGADEANYDDNFPATSTPVTAAADLSLTKSDTPDPVAPGGDITYALTATNNGPSDTRFTLTDGLPPGTTFVSLQNDPELSQCFGPSPGDTGTVTCFAFLSPGTSTTFTVVVHVDPAVAGGTAITNTASATTDTPDPNAANNTATASTTVATGPDVALTKTDSPDPVTAGNNLTYTLTAANNGSEDADGVTVSDTLPLGTSLVTAAPSQGTCSGTTTVTCNVGTLAGGASATVTLVVHVAPSVAAGTVISNTAAATTTSDETNPNNNSATATTTVATSADLAVTKTDSPDPVLAGNNLTYALGVANTGPSDAGAVTLTDTLPAGTSLVTAAPSQGTCSGTTTVTCNVGTLANGASASVTLTVHVEVSVAAGTVLTNTASASSAATDPNSGNNSATATTTVAASTDLAVTKGDSPDPVTAGTDLTYTIVAGNNGPANAQTVTLTDALPVGTTFVSLSPAPGWSCVTPAVGDTGTVTCTAPALVNLDSAGFSLVVHVGPSVPDGTVISNTASISSATIDPAPGNDSATATTTVNASADLSVIKSGPPEPVTAGSDLIYTITVMNNGPSDAQNVSVSDPLPAGTTFVSATPSIGSCAGTATVTCSLGVVAAGVPATITLVVHVGSGVAAGTLITNTASATSTTPDPSPGAESGSAVNQVLASADVALTKTDSPDPVTAGNNITYTLTAANNGPSDAQDVSVTDALGGGATFVSLAPPAGWTCSVPQVGTTGNVTCNIPALPAGASDVFTLVVHVDPQLPDSFVLSNTAFAVTTTFESDLANDVAGAATTVTVPPPPSADLAVTKTDSPDPVTAGNNITYTITVANNGPSQAENASASDTLPPGTTFVSATPSQGSCAGTATVSCALGSIASGASATVTLVVQVGPGFLDAVVTNTATASSTTADPDPANNSGTATTTVTAPPPPSADLAVTKTDTPDPVTAGNNIAYTITVANNGPSQAENASASDTLPGGTTFVSATPSVGSCAGTATVVCSLGPLAVRGFGDHHVGGAGRSRVPRRRRSEYGHGELDDRRSRPDQ